MMTLSSYISPLPSESILLLQLSQIGEERVQPRRARPLQFCRTLWRTDSSSTARPHQQKDQARRKVCFKNLVALLEAHPQTPLDFIRQSHHVFA